MYTTISVLFLLEYIHSDSQVGSRWEGMGSSHGFEMSEAFVGFLSSSRQMAGPGLKLTVITASYLMGTWWSFPSGKGATAWNQLHTSIYSQGYEWMDLYLHSPR